MHATTKSDQTGYRLNPIPRSETTCVQDCGLELSLQLSLESLRTASKVLVGHCEEFVSELSAKPVIQL